MVSWFDLSSKKVTFTQVRSTEKFWFIHALQLHLRGHQMVIFVAGLIAKLLFMEKMEKVSF